MVSLERADGGRETVGALDVGLLVSDSLKAQTLFLLDLQERSVAFYQGVETLEDLNPVFTAPSLTPFSWTTGESAVRGLSLS